MFRLLTLPITSILIFGCMQVDNVIPNNSTTVKPVEIVLSVPTSVAFDKTMAALVLEGYRVDQANKEAGTVKSAGVLGDIVSVCCLFTGTMQPEYFFRANILPLEGGSKVFLSVSQRIHTISTRGLETTPESELYECQQTNNPSGDDTFKNCQLLLDKIKGKLDSLALKIQTSD